MGNENEVDAPDHSLPTVVIGPPSTQPPPPSPSLPQLTVSPLLGGTLPSLVADRRGWRLIFDPALDENQGTGFGQVHIKRGALRSSRLVFEGEFVRQRRHGRGRVYDLDTGHLIYYGRFAEDLAHGFGMLHNHSEYGDVGVEFQRGVLTKIYEPPTILDLTETLRPLAPLLHRGRDGPGVRLLQQGSFGSVFKIRISGIEPSRHSRPHDYAFKRLRCPPEMESSTLRQELSLLKRVESSCVMRVFGICREPFGIVSELLHRNVFEILEESVHGAEGEGEGIPLSWDQKMKIARDTVEGMVHLHRAHVVHADLKWENVMVTKSLDSRDWRCKIIDFGLSTVKESFRVTVMRETTRGTPGFIAPEVNRGIVSYPADVFSFGIMLYCLHAGTIDPFNIQANQNDPRYWGANFNRLIRDGLRPDLSVFGAQDGSELDSSNLNSNALIQLMKRCWDAEPSNRPSFEEIQSLITTQMRPVEELRSEHQLFSVFLPQQQNPEQRRNRTRKAIAAISLVRQRFECIAGEGDVTFAEFRQPPSSQDQNDLILVLKRQGPEGERDDIVVHSADFRAMKREIVNGMEGVIRLSVEFVGEEEQVFIASCSIRSEEEVRFMSWFRCLLEAPCGDESF